MQNANRSFLTSAHYVKYLMAESEAEASGTTKKTRKDKEASLLYILWRSNSQFLNPADYKRQLQLQDFDLSEALLIRP